MTDSREQAANRRCASGAFRGDSWAVALAATLPALAALGVFGVVTTPDTPSYQAYADALRAWPLPSGEALLRSSPSPATLFRTPGYPALLALLQAAAPERWPLLLVALQILAQSAVAAAAHRAGLALGLGRWAAIAAALMPAVGWAAAAQVMVMTDALYGALFSLAALALLRAGLAETGRLRLVLLAGALLGLATTVREATPYIALALLPAAAVAAGPRRRLAGMSLLLAPVALAAGLMAASNHARSGHAVLSTSRQIVMVQATLPALRRGAPVYHGEDAFDRTVRETVVLRGYEAIDELHRRLFEAGYTSPEIAAIASARYLRAWREHPEEMLRGVMVRLPVKMFWITFMPLDAWAELHLRTGLPDPWFRREGVLARMAAQGSAAGAALLVVLSASRAAGLMVTLAAMLVPLLLARRDPRWWPLLGMWCACAGFFGVYAPVHIEQRYLLPVVPLACLLGVTGLIAARTAWRGRRRAAELRRLATLRQG